MGIMVRCVPLLAFSLLFVQANLAQKIAELKCSQYRNLTIRRSLIAPLLLNSTVRVIESFDCPKPVDLIVTTNGVEAFRGEFPHHALLGFTNKDDPNTYDFDCGGSLISENFVLTAAHCFKYGTPAIVRLAEYSLQDHKDNQVDVQVDQVIRHPDYIFRETYNDIALIKLKEQVKFSRNLRPACLWTGSKLNFTRVMATGFGDLEFNGNRPDILQKVELDILNQSVCSEKVYGLRGLPRGIQNGQLCIGSSTHQDTCNGDSGGPVQVLTEPKGCTYHVLGVTSTSTAGCGGDNSAAIYTRVSNYIDWIERIVWSEEV